MPEVLKTYLYNFGTSVEFSLLNIAFSVSLSLLCIQAVERRRKRRVFWMVAGAVFVLLFLLGAIWFLLFRTENYETYIGPLIVIFLFLFLTNRKRLRSSLIRCAMFYGIYISALNFAFTLGVHVPEKWSMFIRVASLFLLLLACVVLLDRMDLSRFEPIQAQYVVMILLVVLGTVLIPIWCGAIGTSLDERIVITIPLLLIQIVTYCMAYSVILEHNQRLELIAVSERQAAEQNMIAISQKNLEDMREIRHDIRNQYAYMKTLLNRKEYDALNAYFQELECHLLRPMTYVDCGNSALNAMLNLAITTAKSQNVQIDAKVTVPQQLSIPDYDLWNLISNILDNAVEACIRSGLEAPTVSVGIRVQGDYLLIREVNPIPEGTKEEELLSGRTSKSDPSLHGFGGRIIDRIAARYNGTVRRRILEQQYILDVMLALPEGSEKT